MSNVKCPDWACVALLALSFLAAVDFSNGLHVMCDQKVPDSCPTGYYCDENRMCIEVTKSSDNTTTYVILGCVLGGVVIIVGVILILYCGKWKWITRLKEQLGGRKSTQAMSIQPPSPYQQPRRRTWAKSLKNRIKLRFGGARRNPYTSNQGAPQMNPFTSNQGAPQMNPFTSNQGAPQMNPFTGNQGVQQMNPYNSNQGVQQMNPYASSQNPITTNSNVLSLTPITSNVNARPPSPSNIGVSQQPQQTLETRYIVGVDNTAGDFQSNNPDTPYVATVALSGNDPPPRSEYPSAPMSQVVQVVGNNQLGNPYLSSSMHSLNSLDRFQDHSMGYQQPMVQAYYPQPSPQLMRPQINIQSQLPEPTNQVLIPTQMMEHPMVLEPVAPPPVVPHTHQVFPSLYPSLGHGHTHAPATTLPTYTEIPRKY